jgi:hypothetical protein
VVTSRSGPLHSLTRVHWNIGMVWYCRVREGLLLVCNRAWRVLIGSISCCNIYSSICACVSVCSGWRRRVCVHGVCWKIICGRDFFHVQCCWYFGDQVSIYQIHFWFGYCVHSMLSGLCSLGALSFSVLLIFIVVIHTIVVPYKSQCS